MMSRKDEVTVEKQIERVTNARHFIKHPDSDDNTEINISRTLLTLCDVVLELLEQKKR
ncbi:hypothetical protein LCGC14_0915400 [marine sediment metagenome]|uniref:Uncharacterized protein n=1 Tax=marine sediment metagenome TaxID=412755 RepID=A0A0F9RB76_9ZZZZ